MSPVLHVSLLPPDSLFDCCPVLQPQAWRGFWLSTGCYPPRQSVAMASGMLVPKQVLPFERKVAAS